MTAPHRRGAPEWFQPSKLPSSITWLTWPKLLPSRMLPHYIIWIYFWLDVSFSSFLLFKRRPPQRCVSMLQTDIFVLLSHQETQKYRILSQVQIQSIWEIRSTLQSTFLHFPPRFGIGLPARAWRDLTSAIGIRKAGQDSFLFLTFLRGRRI